MRPGDDLGERERLGHVVVAADGEAGDLVLDAVAGGEEQDGHADAVGPQASGDLEAVEVGEHHVEHDEVGRVLLGGGQRGPAGHGLADVEALVPQGGGDGVDDRCLVVDDEDLRAGGCGVHGVVPPADHGRVPRSSVAVRPLCVSCEA